mgnify:CR=1 FL=1
MSIARMNPAPGLSPQAAADVCDTVQLMLARIRLGGEAAVRDYAQRLDGWEGEIVVPSEAIARAIREVP